VVEGLTGVDGTNVVILARGRYFCLEGGFGLTMLGGRGNLWSGVVVSIIMLSIRSIEIS
jgi:hypothetical protein